MAEVYVKPVHTGPLLIGCLGHWFLFGAFIVQFYNYVVTYRKTDRLFITLIVYLLFALGIIHTWIETDIIWRMLVVGWGDVSVFQQVSYSASLVAAFSGTASSVVQLFFAWRIWRLCRGVIVVTVIAGIIAAISLIQGISAVCVTIIFIQKNRIPALMYTIYLPMQIWSIGSLLCDIMIAVTMATLLLKARARSLFKSTDKMINHLMTITIETGSITVLVAIIQYALYIKYPMTYIYLVPMYIVLATYSNVLLAALNGRDRVRRYANDTMYTTDIMSAIRSAAGRDCPTSASRNTDQNASIGGIMLRISLSNRAQAGTTDTDLEYGSVDSMGKTDN